MKRIYYWCRNNLIATILAVVFLVSVGVLAFIHVKRNAFLEQRRQAVHETLNRIQRMEQQSVTLPPEKPDDKPQNISVAINPAAVEELKRAYERMDTEYTTIFRNALEINQRGHLPMLEQLFPDPGIDEAKKYDARFKYRDAFNEMVLPYSPAPTYPRLDAGMPPTAQEISQLLAKVEGDFIMKQFPPVTSSELSPKQREDLHKLKQSELKSLLTRRADQIHIYAPVPTPEMVQGYQLPQDTPFDVGEWSEFRTDGRKPEMYEIWEGQMNLWIQQDLVQAIALTNRVEDPNSNVRNAPIKRLHLIRVVPGYIGLDTAGAIMASGPGGQVAYGSREAEQAIVAEAVKNGDVKLPDDFSKAPTGRRSNTIYDVRQVWLVVDVDVAQLPEFFDNLGRVNFMTVLKMSLEDVDEYQALQDGFVYGNSDVMRATMLIETLWMRDWTKNLMPPQVRERLGIEKTEGQ